MKNLIMVICILLSPLVSVRGQESARRYDAPLVIVDETRRIDELGDMDGDGDLDGVGWMWTGTNHHQVEVFAIKNNSGMFYDSNWRRYELVAQVNGTPATTWDSTIADFNGDARDEYLYAIGRQIRIVEFPPTINYR